LVKVGHLEIKEKSSLSGLVVYSVAKEHQILLMVISLKNENFILLLQARSPTLETVMVATTVAGKTRLPALRRFKQQFNFFYIKEQRLKGKKVTFYCSSLNN